MKGDFSRQTFRPEKHYSGVRLQQGRAHLDADWNEQVDIEAYRDAALALDVIGPVGSPFESGGFAVTGGSFLRGIDLVDADNGWAVGERGAILRTTDKGASWALQAAPAATGHLNAVQAVATNNVWAVGDGGRLLRFDGSTWTAVSVTGISVALHGIDVFDATHAWAVGDDGTVLFWDGSNWVDRSVPQLTASLRGVHFATAAKGWAVGDDGTIVMTTNGGTNWTALTAPPGTPRLHGVFFTGANTGFVVGDGGTILSTADAGSKWTRHSASGVSSALRSVRFESAGQNGWAVGQDGTVVATIDGGAKWEREVATDAGPANLTGVALFGGTRLACGDALILRREAGPTRWARRPLPAQGRDLVISAGDIYIQGVRCENERPVAFTSQPDLPGVLPAPPSSGSELRGAYLIRREEHLTSVEREEIREVALRGPDTSTRTRVSWQVELTTPLADDRCSTLAAAIPAGAQAGRMRARSEPVEIAPSECSVAPAGGYRRLENQLYRVEIHGDGPIATGSQNGHATFKWSRDNGSMVARLEDLDQAGLSVTVSTTGRDDVLGFAAEQWVEVNDESRLRRGLPGILLEIDQVHGTELEVLSFPAKPGGGSWSMADFPLNPTVRRWDGTDDVKPGWEELEDGVQVQFGAGPFDTGDFWTLPARTVTGEVEWPRENGVSAFRPPEGGSAGTAALGVVRLYSAGNWEFVRDCRTRFPALTSMPELYYVGGDGQEAMPDTAAPQSRIQLARPLEVGVSNWRWPVEGAQVRFEVKGAGDGRLNTASGAKTAFAFTNEFGVASCIWFVDGTTSDQWVEAFLLDEDKKPVQTPVRFGVNLSTASRVSYDPAGCAGLTGAKTVQTAIASLASRARLEKVGGDDQELLPSENAAPIQVRVVSDCGAVANARVRFVVVDPAPAGGTVNGQRDIPVGPTSTDGLLSANWTLGNGLRTQYVDAFLLDVNGVAPPQPAPVVRFAATLSTARHVHYDAPAGCAAMAKEDTVQEALDRLVGMARLYRLRGDGQRVSPGGASNLRPIEVLVASGCGPVKGASVQFTIREGKGKLQGGGDSALVKTGDNGAAACDWDLDPGTPVQLVEAQLVEVPGPGLAIHPPAITEFTAQLAAEGTMRPAARVGMEAVGEIPDIQMGQEIDIPWDTPVYETVPGMATGEGLKVPAPGIYLLTAQITWSEEVRGFLTVNVTNQVGTRPVARGATVGRVVSASTAMMLGEGAHVTTKVRHMSEGFEPVLTGDRELQHLTLTWLGAVHPSMLDIEGRPDRPHRPDRPERLEDIRPVVVGPLGPLVVDPPLLEVLRPHG